MSNKKSTLNFRDGLRRFRGKKHKYMILIKQFAEKERKVEQKTEYTHSEQLIEENSTPQFYCVSILPKQPTLGSIFCLKLRNFLSVYKGQ